MKPSARHDRSQITLYLPLDGATAAAIIDLCGQLQESLWHTYGAEIEEHWSATEPGQPIYGPPRPPPRK